MGLDPRGGRLQSLIEWAVAEGMPAGIAVKCHLQHATPAAFYAHVPDRGDEKAITRDLLASNIDVLIGAGRRLEKESPEGGSYRERSAAAAMRSSVRSKRRSRFVRDGCCVP